jgi:hypothetical protein
LKGKKLPSVDSTDGDTVILSVTQRENYLQHLTTIHILDLETNKPSPMTLETASVPQNRMQISTPGEESQLP